MGNDLLKESKSPDAGQQTESAANSDKRSLVQQVPFSSCVDPPRLQYEIDAPDVMVSDESKESVHQPNVCFSHSSQSQLTTIAVQETSMTTPPAATDTRTPRLVRDHEMLSSDQYNKVNETDTDDKPSQLEEIAAVPPPFTSTCTSPTRTTMSSDTEHQEIVQQNIEETRKTIEQPQLPPVKTDGAMGERKEISTIEDGSSGTSKTGHSRTKRKHKTATHKGQHGELTICLWGISKLSLGLSVYVVHPHPLLTLYTSFILTWLCSAYVGTPCN